MFFFPCCSRFSLFLNFYFPGRLPNVSKFAHKKFLDSWTVQSYCADGTATVIDFTLMSSAFQWNYIASAYLGPGSSSLGAKWFQKDVNSPSLRGLIVGTCWKLLVWNIIHLEPGHTWTPVIFRTSTTQQMHGFCLFAIRSSWWPDFDLSIHWVDMIFPFPAFVDEKSMISFRLYLGLGV